MDPAAELCTETPEPPTAVAAASGVASRGISSVRSPTARSHSASLSALLPQPPPSSTPAADAAAPLVRSASSAASAPSATSAPGRASSSTSSLLPSLLPASALAAAFLLGALLPFLATLPRCSAPNDAAGVEERGKAASLQRMGNGSRQSGAVDRQPNSSNDGPPSDPICWHSHPLPSSQERGEGSKGWQGIIVRGPGCISCPIGSMCSFSLLILPPAHWARDAASLTAAWKRDLMVTLVGPSLVHARVSEPLPLPPHHTPGSQFVVSFLTWDPGTYRVEIEAPCENLLTGLEASRLNIRDNSSMSSNSSSSSSRRSSSSSSSISNSSSSSSSSGRAFLVSSFDLFVHPVTTKTGADLQESALPCQLGFRARWLKQREGGEEDYEWTNLPCAPPPVSSFQALLLQKEPFSILFLGDGHMRALFLHLVFLLQGFVPNKTVVADSHVSLTVANVTLQLFAYGADLLHHEACMTSRIRKTYDNITLPKSDILIFNGAHWTMALCRERDSVYSERLPGFLRKVSHIETRTKIFVSAPPIWHRQGKCKGYTNWNVQGVNDLARTLLERFDIGYLDSWEILSPVYKKICDGYGMFSCVPSKNLRTHKVHGKGGAEALELLNHVVHVLRSHPNVQ